MMMNFLREVKSLAINKSMVYPTTILGIVIMIWRCSSAGRLMILPTFSQIRPGQGIVGTSTIFSTQRAVVNHAGHIQSHGQRLPPIVSGDQLPG
jgi:hypothetical protein